MKKIFLVLFLVILILPIHSSHAQDKPKVEIYYNEACAMCAIYVKESLPQYLNELGYFDIEYLDYVNEKENRTLMNDRMKEKGIPFELQSHIMTFVGDNVVIGGHVPQNLINEMIDNQDKYEIMEIYQDDMHEATAYKVWALGYEIREYSINEPLGTYLNYIETTEPQTNLEQNGWNFKAILPTVLISGFLDGINPCAFAVLLFFIAFLYTIKRTRGNILKTGIVYIVAIYLAYLSIGFGIFKAILFTGYPHFMAKLASWLIIVLGVINLLNYLWPKFPIKIKMPQFSKKYLLEWMHKATLPAAFILGFLVGLCTFPCSGGIYVAIIGLLAAKVTYIRGVAYMLIYNVMFVIPLIIILAFASNKRVTNKLYDFEQSESKYMTLLSGIVMIILGAIILLFFA